MRKVVSFLSLNFHVFPSLRQNRNKSFMNGQKEQPLVEFTTSN